MKIRVSPIVLLVAASFIVAQLLVSGDNSPKPVTPKASPEARALLKFFYEISGTYTLSGQHNYPASWSRNSEFAARYTGRTPAVFTTDWGFAKEGDFDSHLVRPAIVQEAIRQHQLGSIVSICWHAVPPTADEPVPFRPLPGSNPDSLASVQGQLTDRQFKDLLTPGTWMYKRWCTQVDTIAFYLKQLEDAHVPILWRPYHEMNGEWFWWGGRHGKYGTAALYKQLFDRLVKHHKLRNLIWEWSVDRPAKPEREFQYYFPGSQYFDIVALDVYGGDFSQAYYDSLQVLAHGKPMVLAEVGTPPPPATLELQPKWSYYAVWAGMVRNMTKRQYHDLLSSPRVLSLEDTVYRTLINPFREVCDLSPLPPVKLNPLFTKPDFTGTWVFNLESSSLDNGGTGFTPETLRIVQKDTCMIIERTVVTEFSPDRISTDTVMLNGTEHTSGQSHRQVTTLARWSDRFDSLNLEFTMNAYAGAQETAITAREAWMLKEHGDVLSIHQVSESPLGKRDVMLVYDRKFSDTPAGEK